MLFRYFDSVLCALLTELQDPHHESHTARNEGQQNRGLGSQVGFQKRFLCQDRGQSRRADGDVFAGSQYRVDEAGHEGRVKTILQEGRKKR